MTILDRYILNKFSTPFFCCFLGFIGIWFIFDLSDNLQDFIHGKAAMDALLRILRVADPADHRDVPADRPSARPTLLADGDVALQ